MQTIHKLYAVISPLFRRQRMRRFLHEIPLTTTESILDVGGNPWFWRGGEITNPLTLINVSFPPGLEEEYPDRAFLTGDGCRLPFPDGAYVVVFSNSVIEHVGTWERQRQFAAEARRVGQRLWIQTPAREFFFDPHLLAPFIHWMTIAWQRKLIRNFTGWGWLTRPTPAQVDAFLAEVRLLTYVEMRTLFPDCTILRERFLGMTKSYIAFRPHP